MAKIEIDGVSLEVREGNTVKQSLEASGWEISRFPEDCGLFMPCQTGGCWSCAFEIDGTLMPACITPVKNGMKIRTYNENLSPKRLVGGFMGHQVGGVGTPWWLEGFYVEVACFAAGCNFRCPQCQNWSFTYMKSGLALSPEEASRLMTSTRAIYNVDRMAISGGECTLNRRWLVQYLSNLRSLNPDARLHVDTNGSILIGDYLDELVESGMTDIGIDLKAMDLSTFMGITGLNDEALALKYMKTAWMAVEYLIDEHPDVFIGIGIPYNRKLITLKEIEAMGQKIFDLDPALQVCCLDYRPAFRRKDISRPTFQEMSQVHEILRDVGLETVLCQTGRGRIGPDGVLLP